jgi:hypothetical protein
MGATIQSPGIAGEDIGVMISVPRFLKAPLPVPGIGNRGSGKGLLKVAFEK